MILILGARGQVARALVETARGEDVRAVGSAEFDLAQTSHVQSWLGELKPRAIINAAAYTKVDLAETHSYEAHLLNAELPRELGAFCKRAGIPLIHYSTDYVFGGGGVEPHKIDDPKQPLNVYGKSKLDGEERIRESGCEHTILRTSWVYAEQGQNFVRTMLGLAASKTELRVIDDQIGSPTWAHDLADVTWKVLAEGLRGTHHASGSGFTSWHGFATEIFKKARALGFPVIVEKVIAVPSSEYKTAAVRPLNSRLASTLIARPWAEALELCLKRIKDENH